LYTSAFLTAEAAEEAAVTGWDWEAEKAEEEAEAEEGRTEHKESNRLDSVQDESGDQRFPLHHYVK